MRLSAENVLLPVLLFPLLAGAETVHASIDASKTGAPISPYVYGQFVEHAGGLVNTAIWAEMLDDRKFYHPITSQAPAARPGPSRRMAPRRWVPVGGDPVITTDAKHPFTGDHSPLVALDAKEPHGIQQSGLALRKGKAYTGRVILAGPRGLQVKVSLVWGPGEADRQTATIALTGTEYKRYPLRFESRADTEDGRLEIVASGVGSFQIGAASLMPADNIQGFRTEVISALKQLHSGVYRWPGGNFVSAHEWRNAVGEIDRRPPIWDPVWNFAQPNDVGTDEFLTLCRLLGVDAYITVNAGFGDAYSAGQQVEYVNGAATTPMGRWRAANGHPEPYHVKLWGIGNEPWGDWQMGHTAVEQYEIKHNDFAKAMRKVDPSILLVAGGATPDTMAGSKQSRRISGKVVPEYLSTADWSGHMLAHCLDNIDALSEHYYSSSNQRLDLTTGEKVPTGPQPLVEWMRAPATQVRAKWEHYQEYLKRIPALREKKVPIYIDEWAYMGAGPGSYKVVPAYAWAFHEMFRHSDLFQMGAFTFATAMMSQNRTEAILNPVGLLFQLYADHFGSLPVEVTGDSPQPKPIYPAGGDQPAVNPGSPTFPLDIVAAYTKDRKSFTIAVLNPSDAAQPLALSVTGVQLGGRGKLYQMAPDKVDAVLALGKTPEVRVEEKPLTSLPNSITVPPFSVNLYVYPVE